MDSSVFGGVFAMSSKVNVKAFNGGKNFARYLAIMIRKSKRGLATGKGE